jgi:ATP-dependent RNA helicase DBP3
MLDLGFEQDVRDIISTCKSREEGRQTAMFSATWPAAIQEIASEYMTDPVRVYVGFEAITSRDISDDDYSSGGADGGKRKKTTSIVAVDDSLSANKRVQQNVEVIEDARRPSRLRELLRQVHRSSKNGNNGGNKDRVLVFALYKKEAERLEFSLQRDGWDCCSIHGNKHSGRRRWSSSRTVLVRF